MITFTTGLMGAGKSKELIERYRNDKSTRATLTASLTENTGTEGKIESRNGEVIPALNIHKDQLEATLGLIMYLIFEFKVTTLYIDEIQFLDKETIKEILDYARYQDVTIHFYGLETTFTSDYFESSKYLLEELSEDEIFKISRECEIEDCNNTAQYNARIVNGRVTREGNTFVEEKSTYLSLCKKHYFSKKLEISS
ncbi:thymidine kinase [Priestia aryabhattai]|uniref:thymidine kinase n=1 Tax=Priestia aryabhattai TaxID=412384 RepID=UPI002E2369AF|nr:thymidine kinase [Priestia aryabhattai]